MAEQSRGQIVDRVAMGIAGHVCLVTPPDCWHFLFCCHCLNFRYPLNIMMGGINPKMATASPFRLSNIYLPLIV